MKFEVFGSEKSQTISAFKEKELIKRIASNFGETMPKSPFGAGDDCAVVSPTHFENNLLSTSDAVIYGRHFDETCSPYEVGRKLLNRNISDVASMGGVPKFAMTSAICSPTLLISWLDEFCKGLKDAAKEWGVLFIGGDIASVKFDFFSMHLTLLGDAKNPLLRSGANAGDTIFTTSKLGASFESGRHLTFTPRVKEGLFLSKNAKIITSCTDLSDGVASDIFDILPKNMCAVLDAKKIPIFDFPNNNLQKALSDGEDYELLFTLSKDANKDAFLQAYKAEIGNYPFEIGQILEPDSAKKSSKVYLKIDEKLCEISENGFSHFA